MSRAIITRSLFSETAASTSSWRSHATSAVAHAALILLALAIAIPVTREIKKTRERVTLVAPQVPDYHPKIALTRHPSITPPAVAVPVPPKRLPALQPVAPKPVEVTKAKIAPAPEVKVEPEATVARNVPQPKLEAPAPKPEIHTGSFQSLEAAKAQPVKDVVKTGGFGDPNGTPPNPNAPPAGLTTARVGAFDAPAGSGTAGGGGHSAAGGVHQTAFGEMGSANSSSAGGRGSVHTGGFSDSLAGAAEPGPQRAKAAEPAFLPVKIISKPKPVYTQEAKDLKLEGQVSLEVVFQSSGAIRIVKVLRGLGHGLDEAAEQAALQVRFKPATRAGVPVDTAATINITFALT